MRNQEPTLTEILIALASILIARTLFSYLFGALCMWIHGAVSPDTVLPSIHIYAALWFAATTLLSYASGKS